MAKLIDWIRKTSDRLLDPQKEERVESCARYIASSIREQKSAFDFNVAIAELGVPPRDIPLIQDRVFEYALTNVWRDEKIDAKEQAGLNHLAKKILISPDRIKELNLQFGQRVFQDALAQVMSDGTVSDIEGARLKQIADSAGVNLREMILRYFADWGEGFLRALFAATVEKGQLTNTEWNALLHSTKLLGLTEEDLLKAINTQAERFIVHVLTDAKSDNRLSVKEKTILNDLMDRLKVTSEMRRYVESEIAELELFTNISEGKLPSLLDNHVSLRSGEIVHFRNPCRYERIKVLKSGSQLETHSGEVTVTDYRLLFNSVTRTFEVNHRNVAELMFTDNGFDLRSVAKGTGHYTFSDNNKLAYAIYDMAVRKANQTVVAHNCELQTRHIPRDVRQRVWQRYGGQCADCRATQYLEFDHIIPVAKGGGNDERNVQLLCRNCNLKKSDKI